MKYYLFEDDKMELDLLFSDMELRDFRELWSAGISMRNIATKLKRRPSEIALLVFDHAERGLIKARGTGIYGL